MKIKIGAIRELNDPSYGGRLYMVVFSNNINMYTQCVVVENLTSHFDFDFSDGDFRVLWVSTDKKVRLIDDDEIIENLPKRNKIIYVDKRDLIQNQNYLWRLNNKENVEIESLTPHCNVIHNGIEHKCMGFKINGPAYLTGNLTNLERCGNKLWIETDSQVEMIDEYGNIFKTIE